MGLRDKERGSSEAHYLGSPGTADHVPAVTGRPADGHALRLSGSGAPGTAVTLTGVRVRGRDLPARSSQDISLDIPASQSVALYDRADGSAVELLDVVAGRRRLGDGQVSVQGTMHRMGVPAPEGYQKDRRLQSGRFPLLPSRTVTGNMLAALRSRRPEAVSRSRVAELLVITGAADLASRRVGTLAAEQQWRILVARALLVDPQLVLAEDPTPGLDSRAAIRALDLLMDVHERFGFTLLMATGHLATAARCERVVSLAGGQVAADELINDDAWTRGRIDRIG